MLILSFYMFQSRPRLRFNKEGSLLAVTTAHEGFMILANGIGRLRVHGVAATYRDRSKDPTESTANKVPVIYLALCFLIINSISSLHLYGPFLFLSKQASGSSSVANVSEANRKSDRGSPARSTTSQVNFCNSLSVLIIKGVILLFA